MFRKVMTMYKNIFPMEEETVIHRIDVLGGFSVQMCLVVNVGVSMRCQRPCIESLVIWLMGLL